MGMKTTWISAGILILTATLFGAVRMLRQPAGGGPDESRGTASSTGTGPSWNPIGAPSSVPGALPQGRFPDAKAVAIDLTRHHNATLDASWHTAGTPNHLGEFPKGSQSFGGVPFIVGGIIQLSARVDKPWAQQYPEAVKGIRIGARCKALHLLHGTGVTVKDGITIARLVIHYANGQEVDIPIVYGKHVRDWWYNLAKPEPSESAVAWTGSNEAARKAQMGLRIYKSSWMNPNPDDEVATVDLVSAMAGSAPFFLALTVSSVE